MQKTVNNTQKYFDKIIQILIGFLPWSTLISVFLTYKIGIPGGNFVKEILLFSAIFLLGILLFREYQKTRKNPIIFNWLTISIFSYFIIMTAVTNGTTGFRGLVFGGRYDFIFLIVFLVLYHGQKFLLFPIEKYIKIFLISSGFMLLVSGILKFPLNEELLVYFGYSLNASAWDFGGAPPVFHGIEGAWVRRFQGLLDGPNSMGAFLILFSGLLIYQVRKYKDWYFVAGLGILVILIMLVYTYSRSAMIGFVGGTLVAISGGLVFLYRNYRNQLIALSLIILAFVWALGLKYAGNSESIIGREWSTKGHAERMIVGFERFRSAPFGQGMGSSGPAYRHVLGLHSDGRDSIEEQDRFYIPESWYIQQFVEGGIFGGILFLLISAIIFFSLFSVNSILAGMFAGIGAMNLFLHTYESSVVSWLLFIFIGMMLGQKFLQKNKKTQKIAKN